jgi:DNA-binding NtrC family response regulator
MAPVTLLLVDDEKPFVEIMSRRLRQRGFTVAGVFSGSEAVSSVENNASVDVVVMDITMPGINGIETLQKIKEKHPLMEVIMLTGHGSVPSAIDSMKQGAFDYAVKPCDLEILVAKICAAADRKKTRERKILEIRMAPYLTKQQKEDRISEIITS